MNKRANEETNEWVLIWQDNSYTDSADNDITYLHVVSYLIQLYWA